MHQWTILLGILIEPRECSYLGLVHVLWEKSRQGRVPKLVECWILKSFIDMTSFTLQNKQNNVHFSAFNGVSQRKNISYLIFCYYEYYK